MIFHLLLMGGDSRTLNYYEKNIFVRMKIDERWLRTAAVGAVALGSSL